MSDTESDRRDLQRGVIVNVLGSVIRALNPLLLVLIIRLYGAEAFGTFGILEGVVLVCVRVSLMGLDKGMLWWVAQQDSGNDRLGLRPILVAVAITSTLIALIVATAGAPLIVAWKSTEGAALELRLMAAAIIPMALTEVLLHVALAKRRLEAQVITRDLVVALVFVGAGLGFAIGGTSNIGLPLALVLANSLGLIAAAIAAAIVLRGGSWPEKDRFPRKVLRYAFPLWIAEVANTFIHRVDTFILGGLTDAATVGVYEAARRLARAILMIRRSFDPIVLAIMSSSGLRDLPRLSNALSHATSLVLATQTPVFLFLFLWMSWLIPVLGPDYAGAGTPALILTGFFVITGALGFNGLVLLGAARGDLTLYNTLGSLAAQAILLWLLVPHYGILGAAFVHGLTLAGTTVVQLVQVRWLAGRWLYKAEVGRALTICAVATLAAATIALAIPLPDLPGRITATVVMVAVIAAGMLLRTPPKNGAGKPTPSGVGVSSDDPETP